MICSHGPLVVVAALSIFASTVQAFTVQFPTGSGYWVACHNNLLNWSKNSTDPDHFSVELIAEDKSTLNGNYQVGNALNATKGNAEIYLTGIPAGQYHLLLVNSSKYELNHDEVYYTSEVFTVKPNGTQLAEPAANKDATGITATPSSNSPGAIIASSAPIPAPIVSGTSTGSSDVNKDHPTSSAGSPKLMMVGSVLLGCSIAVLAVQLAL